MPIRARGLYHHHIPSSNKNSLRRLLHLLLSTGALSAILAGCGFDSVQHPWAMAGAIPDRVAIPFIQYAQKTYGTETSWVYQQTLYVGTPEEVTKICRQEVWSCNWFGHLVVRNDGDLCQMIVHELFHSLSFEIFGDWDYPHEQFDYPTEVQHVCAMVTP